MDESNNNIPVNWYLDDSEHEPDWVELVQIHGLFLHLITSYRKMFNYHMNNKHNHIRINASQNGLATDMSINQWQINRYQILTTLRNQHNRVESNQTMGYYLSLLHTLINSACQLKDDIRNGLYINDRDPNLNKNGLLDYMGVALKLKSICFLIISKMLPLVNNTDQQRHLLDFEADFKWFRDEHVTNVQLENIYTNLKNIIEPDNNQL